MDPPKNGCAVKHAKLAAALVVLLLAVAVTVTLAMTSGLGDQQEKMQTRLALLEQGQAAQAERDKAVQASLDRIEKALDRLQNPAKGAP